MGQRLNKLAHTVQVEWDQFYKENFLDQDPKERLEEQLRVLYGRGEIDQATFNQLRFRVHWGMVSQTDLTVIHQQAVRRLEAQGKYIPRRSNPELERSLDRLYADRILLEEMRHVWAETIQALRDEVSWIKEQAESARQDAGAALPNEAAARAFLEVWQKLLALSQTLDGHLQAMEQDLLSLNTLEIEIKSAITKIKLLQSREQIADVHQRIRHDLLTPG
ncbi:MAG: hypothetical protein M1281_17160 [Chloroflexi bacterium]|nr:hypothetical protein [Chloroflexota bacterium]